MDDPGSGRFLRVRGRLRTRRALASAADSSPASTVFFATAGPLFNGKLWSIHADGSDRKLLQGKVLTGPTGVSAVISRDKRRILCFCRGAEIDSMRLDGTHMRRVGRRPRGTKYDVVALGAGGEALWIEERHDRLLIERADGSDRRVVAAGANGRYIEESFAVSRAGDKVAFLTGRCLGIACEDEEEVWVKPLSGGRKVRVYRDVGNRGIDELQWSQDGSALAFVDFPEVEKYEVPADPKDHLLVYRHGSTGEVTVEEPAGVVDPFFSPDGRRLAVEGAQGLGPIYTVGLDGKAPRLLVNNRCEPGICFFEPAVFGWLG